MAIHVRRVSYALGAEVTGVDIRNPLDEKTFSEIHRAFLDHCVLLFRGQALSTDQHVALTRMFGETDKQGDAPPDYPNPKYPEIEGVRNPNAGNAELSGKNAYAGEHWHSDFSFRLNPPAASLLRAIDVPSVGGDTAFANMYLAYESLSDGMKRLIDGIHAVHVDGRTGRIRTAQPLVRTHPETGRKALFLGGESKRVHSFVGMTAEETKPLFEFLCQHATRPQFCYRHAWQRDDLVIWDNRCTLHQAVGDYDRMQQRNLERTAVVGEPSGYTYEG